MKSKYPSPCLKCENRACVDSGYYFKRCSNYHTWIDWWFHEFKWQFRGAAAPPAPVRNKFIYLHPNECEYYLQHSPCEQCKAQSFCDKACPAYLRWWDARMEWIRKKVGM